MTVKGEGFVYGDAEDIVLSNMLDFVVSIGEVGDFAIESY
jgi:hypothetical protein